MSAKAQTHFRFAPSVLARLGEELIPHPELGILELARNAYDADSRKCQVSLRSTTIPGGTIIVEDDGDGMTSEDIREGWLVIGRSRKVSNRKTRLDRFPVGEKGLGRLASLRLGDAAILESRPKSEPGICYVVEIVWDAFDAARVVEDVAIPIVRSTTSKKPGTTITLSGVRHSFDENSVERLARALILLSDPFSDDGPGTFRVTLNAPEFKKLSVLAKGGPSTLADYSFTATLDENGRASIAIRDRSGETIATIDHAGVRTADWRRRGNRSAPPKAFVDSKYASPAATFELWTFPGSMGGKSFSRAAPSERALVRNWLKQFAGVYLYHRGLRVYPYGDAGHDWLDMNLARTRSPEENPSTNNSLGRVTVDDPLDLLREKTDRSGFVASVAFDDLRHWAAAALQAFGAERLRRAELRRDKDRKSAPRRVRAARIEVDAAIAEVPASLRPAVKKSVKKLERALGGQLETVQRDLELYRTLATVGTTVAVFAHETEKPVSQITMQTAVLRRTVRSLISESEMETVEKPLGRIQAAAKLLKGFARVSISLLEKKRRTPGTVDLHVVVERTIELFATFLESAKIRVDQQLSSAVIRVRGNESAVDAILANLITNAIAALTDPEHKTSKERVLRIVTREEADYVVIQVSDSGRGISGITVSDIWLPGETTRDRGNGLGLTIVRDAAHALRGDVDVAEHGDLGGADFTVRLPRA